MCIRDSAKPEYKFEQMYEIRMGLKEGLDISFYVDHRLDSNQMYEIRRGLEAGYDVSAVSYTHLDVYKRQR